jgi:hypothetical protein
MMRRLFALLLIATSGWLLYQTANTHLGGAERLFSSDVLKHRDDLAFVMPAVGGALGLLGGLTVFFNGPGGAALAMVGGLAVAGFTLTLKQTFELDNILDRRSRRWATLSRLTIAPIPRADASIDASGPATAENGLPVYHIRFVDAEARARIARATGEPTRDKTHERDL